MAGRGTALITGASSGIGRAIAKRLVRDGYRVFGTSRNPERAAPAQDIEMVALDVDSSESAEACVDTVLRRAGQLDLLINNAGFVLAGAVEELNVEEARAQFETNVFGVMRMSQAVLPHMRERRRGRVINIGSLAATIAIPFGGLYTASKRALQGITEAMRHELRPFGVDVALVEATFIDTDVVELARLPARPLAAYAQARSAALAAWQREIERGPSVEVVADRVSRLARARRTSLRYPAGFQAWWMPLARPLTPWWLVERLAARRFDLPDA